MKVYIEYVLIDNFVIDYLLLKATFALVKLNAPRKRLFLASTLGAIFALILPILEQIPIVSVLFKICTGLLIVLISNKHYTARTYYVTALTFFALTFLTGGAIIGIFGVLGINYNSEISIALMALPAYLIIKILIEIVSYFYRKKSIVNFIYKVEIFSEDKTYIVNGFLDSGNTAYNEGKPIVFCVKSLAKKLISKNPIKCKIKKIKIKTVNGESQKIAFKVDKLKIYKEDEPNIIDNVTVCVVDDGAFDGYEIILHPALMEVGNDDKRCDETKKVS